MRGNVFIIDGEGSRQAGSGESALATLDREEQREKARREAHWQLPGLREQRR